MKTFLVWLVTSAALFGGVAGGYHVYLQSHPREVLVVVDSSFPMAGGWGSVAAILDRLDDSRYSRYTLWTEKADVHGPRPALALARTVAFAPRDFARLFERLNKDEVGASTRRVLVTNAPESELSRFSDWEVIRVGA